MEVNRHQRKKKSCTQKTQEKSLPSSVQSGLLKIHSLSTTTQSKEDYPHPKDHVPTGVTHICEGDVTQPPKMPRAPVP